MIPLGNEAVTLVKRIKETVDGRTHVRYEAHVLTGCSWRRTRAYRREGDVTVSAEGVTCRVPFGQERPQTGDLLILGTEAVTVESGADFQRLIEQYADLDGGFLVSSVADNARPGMPMKHYAARGG